MINRHLLILFHVLILSCIHLGATEKTADTDSISHALLSEWTEEQFRAYEDSLLRSLYPEVRECHYEGITGQQGQKSVRKAMSYPEDEISNPILPSNATIDRSKSPGEIEIKSGMTATGAKDGLCPAYP